MSEARLQEISKLAITVIESQKVLKVVDSQSCWHQVSIKTSINASSGKLQSNFYQTKKYKN